MFTFTLESEYDVIMPDARGHGLSEAPDSGYGPTEQAADLAELIRELRLQQPAIGGHSMGANTSFYAATNYPGLVRCVILEDPPFWSKAAEATREDWETRRAQMRTTMTERKGMTREDLMSLARQEHPTWSEEELGPWADSKRRVSLNFAGAFRIAAPLTWQEALPKITCPVLLVTADPEKGGIITPEVAEEAKVLLPSLQVIRIPGAGHNIRREQFDGYVEAVRSFLQAS